jgi:hypothetical protein
MMKSLRLLTKARRAALLDQWMTPVVVLRGKGWTWGEIHEGLRDIGEPVGLRRRPFITLMRGRYRRLVRRLVRKAVQP